MLKCSNNCGYVKAQWPGTIITGKNNHVEKQNVTARDSNQTPSTIKIINYIKYGYVKAQCNGVIITGKNNHVEKLNVTACDSNQTPLKLK